MSSLNATARVSMRQIAQAGILPKEIAESWVHLRKNCGTEERREIETERRALAQMLMSLIDDKVVSSRAPLTSEVAMLRKIVDCLPTLKQIRRALTEYEKLGTPDAHVAALTGLDPSAVSRLRNHLFQVEYSSEFLEEAAKQLLANLPQTRGIPASALVEHFPIRVLEFDNNDIVMNMHTRAHAEAAIRAGLVRCMQGSSSLSVELPKGCRGALASIGEDSYIFVLAAGLPNEGRVTIAHELRHIADRYEFGTKPSSEQSVDSAGTLESKEGQQDAKPQKGCEKNSCGEGAGPDNEKTPQTEKFQ
jgi:hypothetical protein